MPRLPTVALHRPHSQPLSPSVACREGRVSDASKLEATRTSEPQTEDQRAPCAEDSVGSGVGQVPSWTKVKDGMVGVEWPPGCADWFSLGERMGKSSSAEGESVSGHLICPISHGFFSLSSSLQTQTLLNSWLNSLCTSALENVRPLCVAAQASWARRTHGARSPCAGCDGSC